MKKLVLSLCLVAIMAIGSNSWAELYSLNFDAASQVLPANTVVTNQYEANFGLTLSSGVLSFPGVTGLPTANLLGATFGTPTDWDDVTGAETGYVPGYTPTSNFLGFNKTATQNSGAAFVFSSMLNSISFDLFRSGTNPGQSSTIAISLFNTEIGGDPLFTGSVVAYNNQAWKPFSYAGSDFNLAVVTAGGNRFLLDNLSYNTTAPVPIPPAVFLFGSGLSGLFFFRRKKFTA